MHSTVDVAPVGLIGCQPNTEGTSIQHNDFSTKQDEKRLFCAIFVQKLLLVHPPLRYCFAHEQDHSLYHHTHTSRELDNDLAE